MTSGGRCQLVGRPYLLLKRQYSVKTDDVVFLYQTLLSREPENQNIISKKLGNRSFQEIISEFVQSKEYQEKFINTLTNKTNYEINSLDFEK